jgi:rhodanese-related sulfurtransferase
MSSSPQFQKLVAAAKAGIREISAIEALEQRRSGAILIDVREAEEFSKGHAENAVLLSRGVLEQKIADIVPNLSKQIICYCGGGSRSALAVESLQRMGYVNAASMIGGFKEWKEQNLPVS